MPPDNGHHLLVFSAPAVRDLVSLLRHASGHDLAALADTCATRDRHPWRAAIVARTPAEFEQRRARAIAHLESADASRPLALAGAVFTGMAAAPPRTACLFPGLGVKPTPLLKDLCARYPAVDAWSESLRAVRPVDGASRAAASESAVSRGDRAVAGMTEILDSVMLADLAMWSLLDDVGLTCDAMVGHSVGENAMLVAAGIVDSYATLVGVLAALREHTGLGASPPATLGMLALSAPSQPLIEPWLKTEPPQVCVSLDNCPQQIVVWGETHILEQIELAARARREVVFRLPALEQPVHTPLLPVGDAALLEHYARLPVNAARVAAWSAATVERFPDDPQAIRALLARQWRTTVRFREVIRRLHAEGVTTFVEVGAGDRLTGFVRDTLRGTGAIAIATNIDGRDLDGQLCAAFGQLIAIGHDLDLRRLRPAAVNAIAPAIADAPSITDAPSPVARRVDDTTIATVASIVAEILGLSSAEGLDVDRGFFDLGLGSVGSLELIDRLAKHFGLDLPQTLPFDFPSARQLAAAIADRSGAIAVAPAPLPARSDAGGPAAIIGMACRFPGGADSPDAFWHQLAAGVNAVTDTPSDRWDSAIFAAIEDPQVRRRTSFSARLDDVRGFDAAFFGISPREARALDPQQRLLLEVAWEALEHAAIDPATLAGSRTGIFVGISHADYSARLSLNERLVAGGYMATGNMAATAAGRLAYVLGTRGPAMAIDTACSSSLTAVHLAVQSLRRGECDMAIAGGVHLLLSPETTIFLSHAQALSAAGRSAAFDAAADGYVRGEGGGMVVLKRLADANAAGDRVLGVIRGSAINHDGRTSGLTVPNGTAQRDVLRAALADAGVAAEDIAFVEAHGTGTSLGDPIELDALDDVFNTPARSTPLRLGAVKTAIGHLEAAAGIAGLIKVVLQHQHRELAPTLHFTVPNPRTRYRGLASAVATAHVPCEALATHCTGVSSFGISGTNAHVVVAPAPAIASAPEPADAGEIVLPLSARSDSALRQTALRLAAYLESSPAVSLREAARTLALGRAKWAVRAAVSASTIAEAVAGLRVIGGGGRLPHDASSVAARFERGDSIDWPVHVGRGRRAALPTYPFERETYWIEMRAEGQPAPAPVETTRATAVPSLRTTLAAATPAQRSAIVDHYLQSLVAAVMDAPRDGGIDRDRPLSHAGLDSLMALQLASQLQQECGLTVAAADLVQNVTLAALHQSVLAAATMQPAASTTIQPATRAPLSYGQRALWFLFRLAPDSTAYHQSLPMAVTGDARHWRTAAERVIARHPMLRTRFRDDGGVPYQIVESTALPWQQSDATGWTSHALDAAMADAHRRPFRLDVEPPIRFHWFATAGGGRLLLTMHHIACDAWSLEILRGELAAFAAAAAAGRTAALPPVPQTYHDFVRWQEQLVAGPRGQELWRFWQQQLAPPLERTEIPTDRPRPAVQTYNGGSVTVGVPADVAEQVRALARDRGVTPFVVLLAAFTAVLYRWSGQRDLIVGVPTAGRSQPQFAGVVGYFIEPVVVRAAIDQASSFSTLLTTVQQAARAALAHGDFPFPLIVERLRAERDASRAPIFDITFNYLSRRGSGPANAPATIEMPQADGKFDLTLTMVDDEQGLHGALGYNTDLYDRTTVQSIGASFVELLRRVLQEPDQPVSTVPLAAGERAAVLQGERRHVPPDRIEQIIERHVHATPAATAVVAADGSLTYAELWARAGELAATLAHHGVGPDVAVALTVPRTTAFVIAAVAVLRAGGAYVPVEPQTPLKVRHRMLASAGVVIRIEDVDGELRIFGSVPPAARAASHTDLAYVIFTSGSTGAPKAVGVEHASLVNYVSSMVRDLAIEPAARHAMVSTVAADLGHTVFFAALTTGGTLHLVASDVATEPRRFAGYLRRHDIDYLKIVPSHLRALSGGTPPPLPRKALILGGESCDTVWLRELTRHATCRVFNHYGPTETTVGVMTGTFHADHAAATLTLDRAVQNTSIWLLDAAGHDVPPGARGEVCVSGAALARGYLNDAAQTAAAFVTLTDGTRAYRTGDVARQLTDGSLMLLGRDDRQIKLRGYRVELAHVERTLLAHDSVAQATVLPDRDGAAASVLWAWVVPAPATILDHHSMASWLAERLPAYMVPRVIVTTSIPLTANGKIDAAALRAQLPAQVATPATTAPRDLTGVRLAEAWQAVLGINHVADDADFFALGGHSLSAVQLASRIAETLHVDLPLSALFMHPRFDQLCDWIRAAMARAPARVLVPLRSAGAEAPVICVPGAGGSLLYFHPLIEALGSQRPAWGAEAIGLDGRDAIPATVEALADIYATAWLAGAERRSPVLAGHSFGALVAFEMARRIEARGRQVEALVVIDNAAPGGAPEQDLETRDWARHIATRIERLYDVDLRIDDRAPSQDATAWLTDVLLRAGAVPAGTTRSYLARYVELYQANVRAAAAYAPAPGPIAAPIQVIAATDADDGLGRAADARDDLGWAVWSRQPVEIARVPGTHITMLREPHVRHVAAAIHALLARTASTR